MALDIISWIASAAAKKVAEKAVEKVTKARLGQLLNSEVAAWAADLNYQFPNRFHEAVIVPEAMFPNSQGADKALRPALARLGDEFQKTRVPSIEVWDAALVEQWHHVQKTISRPQPFFTLQPSEALPLLNELATRLELKCRQDDELFRGFVVEILRDIGRSEEKAASAIITFLENKGLFYALMNHEQPKDCFYSAAVVRDAITEIIAKIDRDSVANEQGYTITDACRQFMNLLRQPPSIETVRYTSELAPERSAEFWQGIHALRDQCREPIRTICSHYGIKLREPLASILR